VADDADERRIDVGQADREAVLGRIVGKVVLVAAVLGAVGILLGDGSGDAIAGIAVGAVIALPLLRVVWLVATWKRQRDGRFVVLGVVLLTLVVVGFVLALLRR
jgi:Na+/proline symporter